MNKTNTTTNRNELLTLDTPELYKDAYNLRKEGENPKMEPQKAKHLFKEVMGVYGEIATEALKEEFLKNI